MFPDDVNELFDEFDDLELTFYEKSEEEVKIDLQIFKKMKELKESGKNIFIFEQKYAF